MSIRRRWNYENDVSAVVCYISTGKNVILLTIVHTVSAFLLGPSSHLAAVCTTGSTLCSNVTCKHNVAVCNHNWNIFILHRFTYFLPFIIIWNEEFYTCKAMTKHLNVLTYSFICGSPLHVGCTCTFLAVKL